MTTRRNPKTAAGAASAGPWNDDERAAVIGLYWLMRADTIEHPRTVDGKIPGSRPTKASRIRAVPALADRSKASIESKLMNVSGALKLIAGAAKYETQLRQAAANMSLANEGYKAFTNMQSALFDDVLNALKVSLRIA